MSESSNTHSFLGFLNRARTHGLDVINSTGIKNEGLEKGRESVSSNMAELEKEKQIASRKITQLEREVEAALRKITQLEREADAALRKIAMLEKEKQDVLSKIAESNKIPQLERELKAALSKITQLEREADAAFRKIAVLEKEKQAASRKITQLEREGETASRKIAQLEWDRINECSMIAVLEKEKQDASSKIPVLKKEKEAALSKITQLEREGEAAFNRIDVLEKGKLAASSKIDELEMKNKAALCKIAAFEEEKQAGSRTIKELEKEKEDATSKVALLEKELQTKEEIFGKYKNTQLQKQKELRTKFQDFKRHTKAEHEKEKEAATSKIAMLEKELESKEVRVYKLAIRALKQIQEEDKESMEKLKELTTTVQKLTEERDYWETLVKQLKGKENETAELVEAQKEMIKVLSDLCISDMDIGVKKIGVIDSSPFHTVCNQKFSHQVAEEKAINLCSIWQTAVEDPEWHPFKTVTSNEEVQAEIIDKEDKELQQLREEWGNEVYLAVATALTEIKEYNTKGRTMTHQLWNFKEGREATLKEAICLMGKKLKAAKIKNTAFVKVNQLEPGTDGKNIIVKVLTTDVVVDETQDEFTNSNRHTRESNV